MLYSLLTRIEYKIEMRYLEESSDCVYHSYRELEEHWTEKIKDRFHTSEDCMSNIYKDNMA